MSIGTETSTGPGRPLGQLEGLLEDLGEQVGRSTRQARLTNGR
jgi:hypothetical protein